MPKLNTQSIQASVASALLSAAIIVLPLSVALYLLAGEWQRAKRTALMALVVIPLAFLLRRYLHQGHVRPVLFTMSLLVWASMSLQLMTAGTIISPSLPVLISVSVIGALAHERLLSWLMPLLCTISIVTAAVLEHFELLPHNLPPSGFSLVLGSILAIIFLALLTRISSDHLARSQQLQHDSTTATSACKISARNCNWRLRPATSPVLASTRAALSYRSAATPADSCSAPKASNRCTS